MAELDPELQPETVAVHAARRVDPATGAVAEPIHLSTTLSTRAGRRLSDGFQLSRSDNPNRAALEHTLAIIEGGAVAAAFAAGLATAMALFAALEPGDHVVAHVDAYYGASRLLERPYFSLGAGNGFVDMRDLDGMKKAVSANTKLILYETPSR